MSDFTDPKRRDKLVDDLNANVNFDLILDDILLAVAENCQPEEVFDEDSLSAWAKENGFVRKNDDVD